MNRTIFQIRRKIVKLDAEITRAAGQLKALNKELQRYAGRGLLIKPTMQNHLSARIVHTQQRLDSLRRQRHILAQQQRLIANTVRQNLTRH